MPRFLFPRPLPNLHELQRTFNLSSFPTCNEIYKCKSPMKRTQVQLFFNCFKQLRNRVSSLIRAGHWTTNLEAFSPLKCCYKDMLLDVVKYKLSKENRAIACAGQCMSHGLLLYPHINKSLCSHLSTQVSVSPFPSHTGLSTPPWTVPHNYLSTILIAFYIFNKSCKSEI